MSPQPSCGNICQIWTRYSVGKQCFNIIEKTNKINKRKRLVCNSEFYKRSIGNKLTPCRIPSTNRACCLAAIAETTVLVPFRYCHCCLFDLQMSCSDFHAVIGQQVNGSCNGRQGHMPCCRHWCNFKGILHQTLFFYFYCIKILPHFLMTKLYTILFNLIIFIEFYTKDRRVYLECYYSNLSGQET